MSLLIPFADALVPPLADRSHTGALHSVVPLALTAAGASTAASVANAGLLFGDASGSSISWSDISTAANSQFDNDTSVVNSNGDILMVPLIAGDEIVSLDWFISTAGVFTGTLQASLSYRNAAGTLVQLPAQTMPSLASTGVKRLVFPSAIKYEDVGEIDDPRDATATRQRYLIVKYSGLTAVTTAPLAQRFWKRRSATAAKVVTDFTGLLTAVDKTPFAGANTIALAGDVTLTGMPEKFCTGFVTFTRGRDAVLATELVYSKGNGVFQTFPAADLHVLSGLAGNDELWQGTPGSYVDAWIPPLDWAQDTLVVSALPNVSGSGAPRLSFSEPVLMAAGDYLEIVVFQDSGVSLNVESAESYAALEYIGR